MKLILKLSAIIVIAFVLWFVYLIIFPPLYTGENENRVSWLPDEATNITYHWETKFGWRRTYYCSIKEQSFKDFAKDEGWELNSLESKTIRLYKIKEEPTLIKSGYTAEKRTESGSGFTVWYDKEKEILYYSANHR